ncbi:MAG: hypothetical protein IT441_07860 [Phycisphaeraceae bacterium]|nr:hypothetical protein [Phycisphaeraceae bacterium]
MLAERDSSTSLWVSALLALGIHAGGVPVLVSLRDLGSSQAFTAEDRPQAAPLLPQPRQVPLGSPESPHPTAVAWIPYEDYRLMTAPQRETEQPALQSQVEPVENAPVPTDPTEPTAAAAEPAPDPSPSSAPRQEAASAAAPSATDLPRSDAGEPLAALAVAPPAMSQVEASPPPSPTPANQAPGNPTAAPRTEQDVSPTRIHSDTLEAKPGGVLVAQGLEVTVARPQLTLITRMTAVPNNTQVRVVFGPDGTVVQAELLKSTGYADVDGPVLASLYAWKARGKELGVKGVEITIRYLLRPEEQ